MRQRSDVKKRNNQHPSRGRECSDIEHRLAQCEATLASIPDGLLVLDKDWRCRYVNEVTAAFLKTAPEELIGKVVWEAFPASRYPRLHDEFTRAAEQKVSVKFENFHESLGRWYECRCYPTDNGMTVLFRDTTSRGQAEETLRESEERLRLAMESGKVGVWEWEVATEHVEWSQGLYSLLGYEPGEVTPTREAFRQRIHPQDLARQEQALQESMERCEDYSCEFRVVWADGSVHWVEARGQYAYLDSENGTTLRMRGVLSDIDRRKQAEEALRDLTRTLESKVAERTAELQHRARQLQKLTLELSETEDRERRQLAEILHDDLQQQLAAAKFHLGLLNHRARHDPAQQTIVAQVDQILMEAIQKSRSLSHELSPAVLYHGDFAGALRWLAGQVQTKHGLEVAVDAFGEVNIESDALKSFLYKAAQEMLFNVVKHARVDKARIRVRRFGRCICLSVSDRGRGFDPQEVRQAAGFGLLSIRERVELLGGRMKMHSLKGHGSTFHVVVPDGPLTEDRGLMTEDGRQKAEGGLPSSVLRPPSSAPRLRVLLADDHEIVREGLLSLLSDVRDIEIVGEAANGREAVNQTYRLQPDVVVMDVAMPLINGGDATRQIKLHLPKTRVIALSMYEEPDMVEKMRRAGAESYILKTAPSEQLLAAIRGKATPAS